jgi:ABC-type multidrug transport system ATPase subunit
MLYYLYNRSESKKLLKKKAHELIAALKLSSLAYNLPAGSLPEDKKRLGLYALAMAKEPLLYILERPLQFLDADFAWIWELLMEKKKNGTAIFVLARPSEKYAANSFEKVINLNP